MVLDWRFKSSALVLRLKCMDGSNHVDSTGMISRIKKHWGLS